jgi:hypothetical protein
MGLQFVKVVRVALRYKWACKAKWLGCRLTFRHSSLKVAYSTAKTCLFCAAAHRTGGESSASIRARVQSARDIQNKRFSNNGATDIVCNADMRVGEVRQFCGLQAEGQSLMRSTMTQLNLSARAYAQHVVTAS